MEVGQAHVKLWFGQVKNGMAQEASSQDITRRLATLWTGISPAEKAELQSEADQRRAECAPFQSVLPGS